MLVPLVSLLLQKYSMISDNKVVFLGVPILSIPFDLFFVSLIHLIDGCITSILSLIPLFDGLTWY